MESILRVDMGAGAPTASLDPAGRYAGLAGRAMTSLVVAEEVDPGCHPLGGGNVLVLAPGPLSGSSPPGSGAVSVGCKSPLTGGIVASRADGPAASALRRLGYAGIVVAGKPAGDDLWTVVIDERGVAFSVENRYRTLGNLETIARLRAAHGPGAALLTIGPAGEMGLGAASLTCAARGPRPVRHCGRGGAGAVMGSKRLKAIVIDAGAASGADAEGADPGAALDSGPPGGRGALEPSPLYRDACGVRDPVVLGQLQALEDDLGLDAAEVAAAVSLAMEAGLARFGDGQATLRLVEEVARGTPLGRIVGSGLQVMAEAFGLEPRIARREPGGPGWPGADGVALAVAEAELGVAAREVIAAERRFLALARAAAAREGAPEGEPGVRPHPIVFGSVDDDLARLFGALDPDADPFDPQLQLPIGLRSSPGCHSGRPRTAVRRVRPPPHKS